MGETAAGGQGRAPAEAGGPLGTLAATGLGLWRLLPRPAWLFIGLIALHLVPVWLVDCFPSQDGPSHLDNARILLTIGDPQADLLRTYYQIDWRPDPNWIAHLGLAGLQAWLPARLAEKVLVSLYLLLLPLAWAYLFARHAPRRPLLGLLVFAFLLGFPLHMGFYSFCLSLIPALFMLGYWLRHHQAFGWRQVAVFGLLGLWAFFSHLVGLVMACVGLGVLGGIGLLGRIRQGPRQPEPMGAWLRSAALWPLLALSPALVLTLAYLNSGAARSMGWAGLGDLLGYLLRLGPLVSFQAVDDWLSGGLAGVFGLATLAAVWRRIRHKEGAQADGLWVLALAWAVVYLAAPLYVADAGFLNHRLAIFPFLALALWVPVFQLPRWQTLGLAASGLALIGGLWVSHLRSYLRLDAAMAEVWSLAEHIEPRSTLLPLVFDPYGTDPDGQPLALTVQPFLHAAARLALRRDGVDLSNYEAAASHFPTRWRPGLDPFRHIGPDDGLLEQPPRVRFLDYPQRTGGRVDYVVLLGLAERHRDLPVTRAIMAQLAAGYDPVVSSSPRGLARLYRRRTGAP